MTFNSSRKFPRTPCESVSLGTLRNLYNAAMISDAKEAAKLLGVQLVIVEAGEPAQFEGAFLALHTARVGAVLVLGGAGFYLNQARIADLALKNRLPSMFQNREFVEAGLEGTSKRNLIQA